MECAAKGRGTRCVGPAIRRCARCGAVAYCSLSHQISHWSDHEQECERLEEQMKDADILNTFPFTFSEEATLQILKEKESRCTFLSKRSIHQRGIWSCECSCGVSNTNHNCPASINCWNLPSTLVPCSAKLLEGIL